MLTGFYSGVSGLYYNEQKLGIVANNLANVDTTGFRRSLMMMRSRQPAPASQSVDRAVQERTSGTNGIERAEVYRDYGKTGSLRQTSSPMDVAIPSELKNAFFAVRKAGSPDQSTFYTRNGTLSIGPVDPKVPDSPTVLYIAGNIALGDGGSPISVDPALGPLKIGVDGVIRQGDAAVGNLPVYRMNKGSDPTKQEDAELYKLEGQGDSLFGIPKGLASEFHPTSVKIGENGVSRLVEQNMTESSNVSVYQELTDMMSTKEEYQANADAIKQQLTGLQKLFEVVRG